MIILKCLLVLVIISACTTEEVEDEGYIKIFQNLSILNQEWLHRMPFPEGAIVLSHPLLSKMTFSDDSNINDVPLQITNDEGLPKTKCSDDMVQTIFSLPSEWALQMLDSDGKLASGIMRGGLIWPGHFSECNSVYAPEDDKGHGNFHGKYCSTTWKLNLGGRYSNLPLVTGLCVPDSCNEKAVKIALNNIMSLLGRFPILDKYRSMITLKDVTCKPDKKTLDAGSIAYLCVVSIFLLLVLIGSSVTVWDYFKRTNYRRNSSLQRGSRASNASNVPNSNVDTHIETTIDKPTTSSDKTSLTANIESELPVFTAPPMRSDSLLKRFFLCFSALANGEKILNTKVAEGQLLSANGLRFLSLAWVILGHTYITSVPLIGNRLDVLKELDTFLFQVLLQSPFSVDSFFFLSGFLLSYLFLKEASKRNGKISWAYFYIHRFWRLTPPYLFVVFFYMVVYKFMGSGPFWNDNHCENFSSTWWYYPLYLNNFIPIKQMCVGWSWYLANDMQFYVISPFILYPLWRWPKIGFSIMASLAIGSWITTGILSYKFDLYPMFVGVTHANDLAAYEKKMWDTFDLIYDKPYCRISPYLIGVVLGFILYRTNQRKNFLNWWQQTLGWALSAFCSLSVIFGLYHVQMDRITAVFYNSLCRSSFTLGLAWVIFACETGHGGFITKILSAKFWIPLSRLTYCAYLVHPILIHGYYDSSQSALYFTELMAVTNFFGFLLMAYGLAFLFSLIFESPFMNFEKLVLRRR